MTEIPSLNAAWGNSEQASHYAACPQCKTVFLDDMARRYAPGNVTVLELKCPACWAVQGDLAPVLHRGFETSEAAARSVKRSTATTVADTQITFEGQPVLLNVDGVVPGEAGALVKRFEVWVLDRMIEV
jgi:phage FluMu protein Com